GRDHATDLSLFDGAEVTVRVADQSHPGIARRRFVGPPRRPASAHREVAARGDVHAPDLLELVRPDLADVQFTHGRSLPPGDGQNTIRPRASSPAASARKASLASSRL